MRQRPVLEVGDDLFDDRVAAVVGFRGQHRQRRVGEHGVVAPGREQLALLIGHDVVGVLVRLAEEPAAVGQVFNIGNDREEITILDLAQRVKARTGSKSEIVRVPYDQAYEEGFEDMPRRVPDLTRLRALTGYEPKVHLDEILDKVIEYFVSDKARI